MLDVYSRCVVGWLLAECEAAQLAKELIATCCARHQIEPGQLTIHADNGSAMQAKSVALLLADLGVVILHAILPIGLTTKAHRGFAAKVHQW